MTPRSSATKAPSARRISPIDADVEQQPLGGVRPVDEPGLDRGVVKEAGGEIVLGDAGRDERARDLAAADREAELGGRFRGLETGAGREGRAVEGKVAVMIGEAERRAVAAQEPPAMAKRRRAAARDAPRGRAGWCAWGCPCASPRSGRGLRGRSRRAGSAGSRRPRRRRGRCRARRCRSGPARRRRSRR